MRSRRFLETACRLLTVTGALLLMTASSTALAQPAKDATPAASGDDTAPSGGAAGENGEENAKPPGQETSEPAQATPPSDVDDPGQSDLDEAVLKRIEAESPAELEAVAALLESALAKGLNDENASFAKKMLGSVLLQRGQGLAGAMMQARGRQQLQMKNEALRALEEAVEHDPTLVEAHLLIARLNLLPEGDKEAIAEATTQAIELLEDDPQQQSEAYMLRALSQDDDEDKLEDLNAAVKADESNARALQARAGLRMKMGDVDGAVKDLEAVLEEDPSNQEVAEAAVQQLVDLDRSEEALKLLSKTIEAKPSEGLYRLRAILYRMEGEEEKALKDLNKALAMQPQDPVSLLQRAEIALANGDAQAAKRDLRAATEIAPQVANTDQAIFVRCLIAIEEERMADAINDMKLLVSRAPNDTMRQLQLANLYLQDERPRQAIDTLTEILQREPDNASVLRSRGDALLAVGEHRKAIEDYERALNALKEDAPERAGVLNNLAWVLATSPEEPIRDGQRAVELAQKAAELTDHQEAHILSTLAAAHAEAGDFEKAIHWSEKTVELARKEKHAQLEQLEEELESYRKGEPWREKQQTEENDTPLLAPEDLIDT